MTPAQRTRWDQVAANLGRPVQPGMDAGLLVSFVLAQERYQVAAERQATLDASSTLPMLTKAGNGRAAVSPYLGVMDKAAAEMAKAASALGFRAGMRPASLPDPDPLDVPAEFGPATAPFGADDGSAEEDLGTETDDIGLVTKRELCMILGIGKPTLDAWIDKYGSAFPIVSRGTYGRGYQFDRHAVVDFLRGKQEDQKARKAERDEQLQQLMLPLAAAPAAAETISLDDRIKAERLNVIRMENARKAGALVAVAEIEAEQMAFLSALSRNLQSWGRQFGRTHGWPEGLIREIEASMAALQRATVREHLQASAAPEREGELQLAVG